MTRVAAVDLGASGGRVISCSLESLELTEVARFPNEPVRLRGTLHWDILGLYRSIVDGLSSCAPDAVGIDSWAVDYGLLRDGVLLGNPVHYRDSRTDGVMERVRESLGDEWLYARSGLQFLPFNTIYQLAADPLLGLADRVLLIPDLITYWLTGTIGAELTNASTTGLLNARSREWDADLLDAARVPEELLPPLRAPGSPVGGATGLPGAPTVIAVASHDTASAVAAVPASSRNFAYISCGTWSLAGVELDAPILTAESRDAGFTNEAGIDGTVRYLRNVMGLWLLQESMRSWGTSDLAGLLAAAADVPPLRSVVDAGSAEFLAPGDMPARLASYCARTDQPVPSEPAVVVRCILDSLALAHRAAIQDAARLSGRTVDVVHLVGGGSRNDLLCRLTASACGLPVVAGPAEATALGNILVQARALGRMGDLAGMRSLVAQTQALEHYEPAGPSEDAWLDAAARL